MEATEASETYLLLLQTHLDAAEIALREYRRISGDHDEHRVRRLQEAQRWISRAQALVSEVGLDRAAHATNAMERLASTAAIVDSESTTIAR